MHILFISSSLPSGEPSPIIANQAKSIEQAGCVVDFFPIRSKGIKGYFKSIFQLRRFLKSKSYDIYHAHYGLSAIVTTFAGVRPLVVSLMGSDIQEGGWQKWIIKRFAKHRWQATIAKSDELAKLVGEKYCEVIPNGVDLDVLRPMPLLDCREKLNLSKEITYILFAANPKRAEKNFELCNKAFQSLQNNDIILLKLEDIPHKDIPVLLNAVDVVVLASLWEGSPNVIKEAMVCNRPIVSTNVGDVQWLFGQEHGHFIAGFDVDDYGNKLKQAIEFSNKKINTNGRERIEQLGLDSQTIAQKIIAIYKGVFNEG